MKPKHYIPTATDILRAKVQSALTDPPNIQQARQALNEFERVLDREEKLREDIDDATDVWLTETSLTVRTTNALATANIVTVADLAKADIDDLYGIRNFSHANVRECELELRRLGVKHDWRTT